MILTISCQNQQSENQVKVYYDLNGFIKSQIQELTKIEVKVQKRVLLDDKKEEIKIDKIDWDKELELFIQADLNKQAYQLSYDKIENDSLVVYQLKNGEKLPVSRLEILFDDKKNPRRIEARLNTKNYLYESSKTLKMVLENNRIQNYKIEGWQELFIGSKKIFSIEGNITSK
jgi:hypothetical protein